MNLECHVCIARKVATSFHSMDDLQAHLFSIHHDGPSDVFQFVCQNCEFKFATEYRHLKHEETCSRESRRAEDMENIRNKLQTYKLLEESLKYNMTKSQTSSVPPTNPSNIETTETQTASSGTKIVKPKLPEPHENPVSNSHQKNNAMSGNDQNCSTYSVTNTQPNAKNSQTSEWSILTFEWSSDLINFSDEEREVISYPPSIPERLSSERKSLLPAINPKSDLANVLSDSENEKWMAPKLKAKINKTSTKNKKTSAQSSIRKKTQIGSFVFSDSSDGSFIEFRKSNKLSETTSALKNDCVQFEMSKENNVTPSNNPEEAHSSSSSDANKKLLKQMVAFKKTSSEISGSGGIVQELMEGNSNLKQMKLAKTNLGPTQIPRHKKKTFVCTGNHEERINISNSTVANMANKIHVFGAKKKTMADLEQNLPSENVSASSYQSNLPEKLTNKIFVSGPCLHPDQVNPRECQMKDLRRYFRRFGKIVTITTEKMDGDMKINSSVIFDNCESVTKCLQQGKHKIVGRDFIVRAVKPTKSMKKKLGATLNQNMPDPSSENVFSQNVQGEPVAELNLGNQMPSFDKPRYK